MSLLLQEHKYRISAPLFLRDRFQAGICPLLESQTKTESRVGHVQYTCVCVGGRLHLFGRPQNHKATTSQRRVVGAERIFFFLLLLVVRCWICRLPPHNAAKTAESVALAYRLKKERER